MTAANSDGAAKRKPRGKPFAKGQSGNPSGRKKVPADVIEAAKAHTQTAISTLADICTHGADEKARISAAEALLNRAWGKPTERHELTGANGGPVHTKTTADLTDEELAAEIAKFGIQP